MTTATATSFYSHY